MLLKTAAPSSYVTFGRRRGAAAVEFAFVCPFLIFFLLGMAEMSRMVMVKVALNNAARAGCQTGTLSGKGNQDINSDVSTIMATYGFDASRFNPPAIGSIVITVTDPTGNTVSDALAAAPDSMVSVKVTIPVSSTVWISSYFAGASSNESETVAMRKQ
jgi:Flp pilus assembly protein TadG